MELPIVVSANKVAVDGSPEVRPASGGYGPRSEAGFALYTAEAPLTFDRRTDK